MALIAEAYARWTSEADEARAHAALSAMCEAWLGLAELHPVQTGTLIWD